MSNKGMFTYAIIIAPWLFVIIYLWVLLVVPTPGISEKLHWYHALPMTCVFWFMFILPVAFCLSVLIDAIKAVSVFIHNMLALLLKH